MNFGEYQEQAKTTAVYPRVGDNLWYPTLGLCGEAGEVAEIIKKVYRDNTGIVDEERKQKLSAELGDVLWYISGIASELHLSLDAIAKDNIDKLSKRQSKGTLHGSGSDR